VTIAELTTEQYKTIEALAVDYVGLPFDRAVMLSIDWKAVADDLSIRQLTGNIDTEDPRQIERLALVALAYYSPRSLGIDPDELEHPDFEPGPRP
jgi:hypothetical protein